MKLGKCATFHSISFSVFIFMENENPVYEIQVQEGVCEFEAKLLLHTVSFDTGLGSTVGKQHTQGSRSLIQFLCHFFY